MIPTLGSWLREAADDLILVEARLPRTLRALYQYPPRMWRHPGMVRFTSSLHSQTLPPWSKVP